MKFSIPIIILVLLLIGCGESKIKPGVNYFESEKELPVQESWDSKIYFSESGKLKAILYADRIRVYADQKTKLLEGVKILFYNEEEEQSSSLTSKRGKVNDATQDMYAIDSVVAVSDSGVTLLTDELVWKNKESKIFSDDFVTIISKDEKIEGYGFESDQSLTNYVIHNITYYTNFKENSN